MSPTPRAGWYDDPEHPSQYRYWDGSEWTAHRSPKQTPPPPAASSSIPTSATGTVSAAFTLFGQHWVSLLGLAAIAMLGFAAAAVAFVIGLILYAGRTLWNWRSVTAGFDKSAVVVEGLEE